MWLLLSICCTCRKRWSLITFGANVNCSMQQGMGFQRQVEVRACVRGRHEKVQHSLPIRQEGKYPSCALHGLTLNPNTVVSHNSFSQRNNVPNYSPKNGHKKSCTHRRGRGKVTLTLVVTLHPTPYTLCLFVGAGESHTHISMQPIEARKRGRPSDGRGNDFTGPKQRQRNKKVRDIEVGR